MNPSERRTNLIQQINNIKDEQTLEMLEDTLGYYTNSNQKDITDCLDRYLLKELQSIVQEPAEKDTISEKEYKK